MPECNNELGMHFFAFVFGQSCVVAHGRLFHSSGLAMVAFNESFSGSSSSALFPHKLFEHHSKLFQPL